MLKFKNSLSALAILAWLVSAEMPATANDFSLADYDRFHELDLRIRPVSDDLSTFMMRPPMPGNTTPARIEAAVRTQDCMIRLAGTFDLVRAKLDTITTLVGLAARMVDDADLGLVTGLLNVNALDLLMQMKFFQQMTNLTVGRCSQDGATVAKAKEISRIYKDAGSLVQSIVEKVGASPQK